MSLYRKLKNYLFYLLCLSVCILCFIPFYSILQNVVVNGLPYLNLELILNAPKPIGESGGGIAPAIFGSLMVISLALVVAVPVGIACGTLIAEYPRNLLTRFINNVLETLSGIPSIVIGILCFALAVLPFKQFSALAGSLSLLLMMVPIISSVTKEVLRLIPNSVREAGLALGLRRTQVIWHIILKGSWTKMITGVILAISRAAGETAPLLFTAFGNLYFSYKFNSPIATMPVQIYQYATSPFKEWQGQAWAGSLMLILGVLSLNFFARWFSATKSQE